MLDNGKVSTVLNVPAADREAVGTCGLGVVGDVTARLGTLVRVREGGESERAVGVWGKPPLAGNDHG